jgi:DNA adenine methylase
MLRKLSLMKLDINDYPGSKNGNGCYQWIINHIPEYSMYGELFGGGAAIARRIAPLVPDKDHIVYEKSKAVFKEYLKIHASNIRYFNKCGIEFLKWRAPMPTTMVNTFLYLDPPYTKSSRRDPRNLYEHEWTDEQHEEFLSLCVQANFNIMISGYDCEMYNKALKGWHTSTFETMTRGGMATEKIWMNYDISELDLATTEFVGVDYIDRQRINRKKKLLVKRLMNTPRHERQALLEAIQKHL